MISSILNWLIDKLIANPKFNDYIEGKVLERYIPAPGLNEEEVMALIRGICEATPSSGGDDNESPVAGFSFSCTELACDFDGTESSDADGAIVTYSWDLGDGTLTTGSLVSHTYDAPGDYVVTLTVVDNSGDADSFSDVVELQASLELVQAPDSSLGADAIPAMPSAGEIFVDVDYDVTGTQRRRVSNANSLIESGSGDPAPYAVPTYSRRNPFNADNSWILVETGNNMYLLDAETGDQIGTTPLHTTGDTSRGAKRCENVWDYNNPKVMYALASDPFDSTPIVADQFKMNKLDLTNFASDGTGTPDITELFDLRDVNFAAATGFAGSNSIEDAFPGGHYMWSIRGEGMPSAVMVDPGLTHAGAPRYWAFSIADDEQSPSNSLGVVTYDLQTNTIIGLLDFSTAGISGIDHIDISASGQYVEIAVLDNCPGGAGDTGTWADPCGTMIYTADFSSAVGAIHNIPHGDFVVDAAGHDVYVFADFSFAILRYIDPATGNIEALADFDFIGSDVHVSGNSFNRPGYVMWSQYDTSLSDNPTTSEVFNDKFMLTELVPGSAPNVPLARTWYLGHSFNRWASSDESAPHPAVNYDLTRMAWGSNWTVSGTGNTNNMETYVLELDLDGFDLPD